MIVTRRGKSRHRIKRRGEKGYFNNIVKKLMIDSNSSINLSASASDHLLVFSIVAFFFYLRSGR